MERQRNPLFSLTPFSGLVLSVLFVACGEHPGNENRLGSIGGDSLRSEDMVPAAASNDADARASNGAQVAGAQGTPASVEAEVDAIRAEMLAELEAVRDRLNVGDAPAEQHRADTRRAAELALGLERAERTSRLLEATEEGWPAGRDTVQDAVTDLRSWWQAHQAGDVTALVED